MYACRPSRKWVIWMSLITTVLFIHEFRQIIGSTGDHFLGCDFICVRKIPTKFHDQQFDMVSISEMNNYYLSVEATVGGHKRGPDLYTGIIR